MKIKILIPIYNDWESLLYLLKDIDENVGLLKKAIVSIFIVNDGSDEKKIYNFKNRIYYKRERGRLTKSILSEKEKELEKTMNALMDYNFELKNIKSVEIMHLKKNQGHAKAIAAGLGFIHHSKEKFDYVIPMDGDGEDRPEELYLFFKEIKRNPNSIIIGKRVKRSEGLIFRICYLFHKFLTAIYLDRPINFGNYVCLPKHIVASLVQDGHLWFSFSGTLYTLLDSNYHIPSVRGKRHHGPSKMSFLNLLKHSIMIFSVNKEKVFSRALIGGIILGFSSFFAYVDSGSGFELFLFFLVLFCLNFIFYLIVKISFDKLILEKLRKEEKEEKNPLENVASVEKLK